MGHPNFLSEVVRYVADCGYHNNIFDFRGADLFYRNKKYRGIVPEVQPTIFCLGWDKDAL
jgi:hypothetical protein